MNPVQTSDEIELRSTREVFSALTGTWELSRTVGEWNFHGNAVFGAHGPYELRYEENGILAKPGNADIQASRRYVYQYEAGRIAIYFNERPARIFEILDLKRAPNGTWEAEAEHACDPDHYASRYIFGPGTIMITHVVRGPRKSYVMVSNYRLASH